MKKELLAAEYMKLWKSGTVKVWCGMLVWVLLLIGFAHRSGNVDMENGSHLAAGVYNMFGLLWFWLNSIAAVNMLSQEYEEGTIRNVFACGVGRKKVFAAKMAAVFSADLVFVGLISLSSVVTIASGEWEEFFDLLSGRYWGQILTGILFLALVTIGEQLLASAVGILSENSVVTVAFTAIVTFLEMLLWLLVRKAVLSPVGAVLTCFRTDKGIMWTDFAVPAIWAVAAFLICRKLFLEKEVS